MMERGHPLRNWLVDKLNISGKRGKGQESGGNSQICDIKVD